MFAGQKLPDLLGTVIASFRLRSGNELKYLINS